MEALMRDVQYEQRTQSTFNGEYDFSLKPIKDRRYGSDKSYLIRLNVRDSSEARGRRLLPPEPGTAMTVRVILGLKESIPQDFVGKMIPSSSAEHENHVSVTLNRKSDQTELILIELHDAFSFESRGSLSRQIKRSIKQLMYGGAGVFKNSWLKKLLLAHNPFSNDIQLLDM